MLDIEVLLPTFFLLSGNAHTGLSSDCQQRSDEARWIGRWNTAKVTTSLIPSVSNTVATPFCMDTYINYNLIYKSYICANILSVRYGVVLHAPLS